MEKLIVKASYWLGVLFLVLAFLARGLNILGPDSLHFMNQGNPVGYHSFVEASVLFFLLAIATGTYASFRSEG